MDNRKLRTLDAIKDAFVSCLRKKSFNEITVSEIAKIARISRITFYSHYDDIFDLQHTLFNNELSNLDSVFNSEYKMNTIADLSSRISTLLLYLSTNKDTFNILDNCTTNDFSELLYNRLVKEFYHDNLTNFGHVEISFVTGGLVSILRKWNNEEFSISIDEMTKIMIFMLNRFINLA